MSKMISRTIISSLILGISFASASFKSEIFFYDDPEHAKNLHVHLKGAGWSAKEVNQGDLTFHKKLYGDPKVMSMFADGQPRAPEQTETIIVDKWIPRFQNGQPHGGMTVYDVNSGDRIGCVVAGASGKGISEIAGAGIPDYWGKKIGTEVMKSIITEWAPEVRRVGLGQGLDEIKDALIIKAFRCFDGEVLQQFDATASPSNLGSWKILENFEFKPAVTNVVKTDVALDFSSKEFESPQAFEKFLLTLYSGDSPLKKGTRYSLIDPTGKVRTFSLHERFDRFKYHYELRLH